MKLFLSSFFAQVPSAFNDFTQGSCAGKHVAYIPTASIPEQDLFYVAEDKEALQNLGLVIDEVEVSKLTYEEIEKRITNADYIFVEGGNTFFLLQELRRSGADRLIKTQLNKGIVYIGMSAGSIIASQNIEYIKHMDDPATALDLNGDYRGLGLIDFSIVPHCTDEPFKEAVSSIKAEYKGKLDLRFINNSQAFTINGDKVELITVDHQ
jgi:dipeptidase E